MNPPQPFLGFLVPGGPVRTDFVATDPTKLTLTLQAPGDLPMPLSSVSDVVCFLLPNAPLPPTHGLLLYWQVSVVSSLPAQPPIQTGFELLGSLTHATPSAIFRTNWSQHEQISQIPPDTAIVQVTLGVSMEPLADVANLGGELYDSRLFVAQKIATDLFHYMQSFDTSSSSSGKLVVPTNIFDRWMKRFEARFRRDPNFFMKHQD
eukprot:CAMPEP_0119014488 /NCGR_PEP_ID=MMETSP1176-20130426/9834_1 /TAXON_ID=265551 /ORGANISM="Synedropsis recta cf, Strain CCMP1620" /LENGTH=205 /DNA_ID=CAMNT_0006967677 /DNA_START=146 /DNA_END=763 /DNA_ORIENTATION=+